jgi:tetratricopeptide (TPR) repeat protein
MLNSLLDIASKKDFMRDPRQAYLGLPEDNPLLARMSVTVKQKKDDFSFDEPTAPTVSLDGHHRFLVAKNILDWQRREALRQPLKFQTHVNLGIALESAGDYDQAESAFNRALELAPNERTALLALGRLKITLGQLEDATEIYRKVLLTCSDDSTALLSMAQIYMRQSRFDEAIILLRKAAEQNPDEFLIPIHLAIIYILTKQYRAAIASLRRASTVGEASAPLYHLLGIAYFYNNQLRKSERALQASLRLAPTTNAFLLLCLVLLQTGHIERAKVLLRSRLEAGSKEYRTKEMFGSILQSEKKYKIARRELQEALELCIEGNGSAEDRSRLANNIGVCAAMVGDNRESEKWFRQAISLSPGTNVSARENLGRILLQTGRVGESAAVLDECRRMFPDSRTATVLWAVCRGEEEDYETAMRFLEAEIERNDGLAEAFMAGGHYLYEMQMYARSIQVLRTGLERFPDNLFIRNNLAYAHLMQGHVNEGREILGDVSQSINDITMTATVGLLRLREGDIAGAREWYGRASLNAAGKGNAYLSRVVRQKMHLELARYFLREGKRNLADIELDKGLAIDGRKSFKRELENLNMLLTRGSR